MRIKRLRTILNWAVLVIPVMQVLLFLVSWLINAAMPESQVRSLLGSEGIRWFFGSFVDNVAASPLVWLLTAAIAYGATRESGIVGALKMKSGERRYRQTFALRIVFFMTLIFIAVMAFLTVMPRAALLSVTGQLFPSSFSRSIIPCVAFCVMADALAYGVLAGTLRSLDDMVAALTKGIASAAPLILLYVLASELFASCMYVFGW
ncbi:MAG: AbgT family transporter [Prevotella sp.]|nr:AbgT family transporter [Prevotella sp.]